MNTIAMPGSVPAVVPVLGGWRPSPQAAAPAYHAPVLGQARWKPQLSQQGISVARGADVLFSLLTGVGAMTIGIAAMTVGIGGTVGTGAPAGASPSTGWKVIGGITAALGALVIMANVLNLGQLSRSSPASPMTTTPTTQPRT